MDALLQTISILSHQFRLLLHELNTYIDNLIKGNSFYIQFSNIQTRDIKLDIINSTGDRVFQKDKLNNQISAQPVQVPTLTTGIYYVKVFANNKVYVQSVFVTNN